MNKYIQLGLVLCLSALAVTALLSHAWVPGMALAGASWLMAAAESR